LGGAESAPVLEFVPASSVIFDGVSAESTVDVCVLASGCDTLDSVSLRLAVLGASLDGEDSALASPTPASTPASVSNVGVDGPSSPHAMQNRIAADATLKCVLVRRSMGTLSLAQRNSRVSKAYGDSVVLALLDGEIAVLAVGAIFWFVARRVSS